MGVLGVLGSAQGHSCTHRQDVYLSGWKLEDIIAHHPGVAEVAVIGTADEKWGERPLALVIPRPDSALTEKDITHHVREYADKGLVNKQVVLARVEDTGCYIHCVENGSDGRELARLLTRWIPLENSHQ